MNKYYTFAIHKLENYVMIDSLVALSCLLYGNISGYILSYIVLIILPYKIIYNNIVI